MKLFLTLFIFFSFSSHSTSPELLLAKTYHEDINIKDYWVSEKLDGVRAIWTGKKLISRQGIHFKPPQWFIKDLPNIYLDGELWITRNTFDEVSGLVRRQNKQTENWSKIKYMIFDLPKSQNSFDQRVFQMRALVDSINIPHFKAIKQFKVGSKKQLLKTLDDIVENGGEGLMLHRGSAFYKSGRSNDLLKLKKHLDAEAKVIKHIKGKGKYLNQLGALLVETKDKLQFKIGSGFSDKERLNPPPIGATITYKYFGLTKNGLPRFASFLRIKEQ